MHIFICLLLSLLSQTYTQPQVGFTANSTAIVFHANWVQDVSTLQNHVREWSENIVRENFQVIDLSFTYCNNHQYILQNIFKYKLRAKSISINLDSCPVGDQGIINILSNIDQSVLEELTLGLNSIAITHSASSFLGSKLSKLKLRKLSVDLVFNKLGDKGVSQLLMHPLSGSLQALKLDLTYNKLTAHALRNMSEFVQQLDETKMRELVIKLGSNKIEEKGSLYLSQALQKFKHLQLLEIDLYFNNIKAKGTSHICSIIKQQANLQHLSINFDLNYIQTEGGKAIGEALKQTPLLQTLQIGVANRNFGLNGFLLIVEPLGQLTKLKSLVLRAGINRIGLKGVHKLAEALSKLTLLRFDFGFTENFITDEGFEVISNAIRKQAELRSIKLNLGFNEARGYGPIALVKILQAKVFQEVSLGLSNNPLEDKDIKLMVPLFQSMVKKNSKFELQMLDTKISEQLSKQIRSMFESAKAKGERVDVHINSSDETTRIKEQLEGSNNNNQVQL